MSKISVSYSLKPLFGYATTFPILVALYAKMYPWGQSVTWLRFLRLCPPMKVSNIFMLAADMSLIVYES